VFTSPVLRHHGTERAWTEHLATNAGARALLEAVARAPLPPHLSATLDEVLGALADATVRELGASPVGSTRHAIHQLHLEGRFPDVVVNDPRERPFAVIEAQRGRADDRHIAKLAAHYVPASGARLGVLVAERWGRAGAGHPAWAVCPAPVAVVLALDTLHEIDYQVAWVHHPSVADGDEGIAT
jgi:hypothetical protein